MFLALIDLVKVIIYVRVSTDDQAKHGYSLESQIERCAEHQKQKYNADDDEILVIVEEGESGDNPDRPALNYLLYLVEEGMGRVVYVLHPDRLSRFLHLQTNVSMRIWNAGCDLQFVEFDLDKDNPESMLMYNIQGSISQYNKAKILANSKRGKRQKAKKGKLNGGKRFYGYIYDKETSNLSVNEFEKEIYLRMVSMLLEEDCSCSDIARQLAEDNVAAPSGNYWYQSTVTRILRNELYTGISYYGKTEVIQTQGKKKQVKRKQEDWIPVAVPAYITNETYLDIQKKIDSLSKVKSGRPTQSYLLKGLSRCGRCGAAASSGITSVTKRGILKYYTCNNKSKKEFEVGTGRVRKKCRGRNWRVDHIDNFVWEYILSLIYDPVPYIETIIKKKTNISNNEVINKRLKKLEKAMKEQEFAKERYIDLYACGMIKSKEDLEKKTKPIEEKIKDMSSQISILNEEKKLYENKNNEIDQMKTMLEHYSKIIDPENVPFEMKRKLVKALIHSVTLNDNMTIDVVLKVSDSIGAISSVNKHRNQSTSQSHGGS
ncbi:recombinase family protein [Paenibacillus sp. NAIST15-1]|uniref:recombinase family protein n=1 Tax=Paenibacillus sp. NAIST15-1 TaxID=1605994 RepID=UPI001D1070F1|nr:recombinase family protein [Paenibacillus sp. NAIST15-1]